jgi:phosphatidylglycerol:prolipoprotein diacylglycerol transferase
MNYISIDPVIFDLGFVKIYWYGVMYLLAFISAYLLAKLRIKKTHLFTNKEIDDLIFYGALGAVIGGRFGYLMFYSLPSFIDNPLIFLSFQNGGMSFHGGFIGVLLSMMLLNRKTGKTFFQTTDFIAPLVPLGLFFGRIGNYINGELWGKTTSSYWGVYSPDYLGEWAYRYPTQLFEALLEGILLFAILWLFTNKSRPLMTPSSLFLILYGLFRFIIEFIRMPDAQLGYLAFEWLTMGQLLSLPMIIIGVFLFYKAQLIGKQL